MKITATFHRKEGPEVVLRCLRYEFWIIYPQPTNILILVLISYSISVKSVTISLQASGQLKTQQQLQQCTKAVFTTHVQKSVLNLSEAPAKHKKSEVSNNKGAGYGWRLRRVAVSAREDGEETLTVARRLSTLTPSA